MPLDTFTPDGDEDLNIDTLVLDPSEGEGKSMEVVYRGLKNGLLWDDEDFPSRREGIEGRGYEQ